MSQDLALKHNTTETGRHLMDQGWLDSNAVAEQETFACWRMFTMSQEKVSSAMTEGEP
jgi:hypothetical protein